MSTATLTLTDFLLARIAEDEADARGAALHIFGEPRWSFDEGVSADVYRTAKDYNRHRVATADEYGAVLLTTPWENGQPFAQHAARWNPARAIAECEAKRRVIEAQRQRMPRTMSVHANPVDQGWTLGLNEALHALALPYADHPDYDESWRP